MSGRLPPFDDVALRISSIVLVLTHATVPFPSTAPPQPRRVERSYQTDGCHGVPDFNGAAPDSEMNPFTIGSLALAHAYEYMSTARAPADSPNSIILLRSPGNNIRKLTGPDRSRTYLQTLLYCHEPIPLPCADPGDRD
jgi:hypothetical protein